MTTDSPILEMRGIRKVFPGVVALSNVDFDLFPARYMRWWAKTARANPR